jgi:RecB family exonuclease
VRSRVRTRQPALWEALVAKISHAIDDLLRRDLRALLPAGVVGLEVEQPISASIDLGEESRLRVAGAIDRLLTLPDGTLRVGDYKTSRDFKKPVSKSRIKKGTSLQLPLYALAVAADRERRAVIGEALPVPLRPERDLDEERDKERALPLDEIEALARPVLRELTDLLANAEFPFHHDGAECRYCPYTVACRHEHSESRERVESAPGLAGWHAFRGESS